MALKIKDWSNFQHFKDRKPPWIKLYRDLLDNFDYYGLSDKAGKCLILLWLIASEHDGNIPSVRDTAFRLRIDESNLSELLNELKDASFLVDSDAVDIVEKSTARKIAEKNGFGSRHISDQTRRDVWARDGGKCCSCNATKDIEYDHVHPVSKGGNSDPANVQLLCRPCNRKKRAKTAEHADTAGLSIRTLETERERETEKKSASAPGFVLPDWIPIDAWDGYVEMRKKKRAPMTDRALSLKVSELLKFRDDGHDVAAILDKSTSNGWTDLYEPKTTGKQNTSGGIMAGAI